MKQFFVVFAIIGSTLAAPWVVLDTRNDMLAMSSEVSDAALAYAVPPTTQATLNDETATTPASKLVPVDDYVPVPTTEQQALADPVPEPYLVSSDVEEKVQDEIVQTTTSNPIQGQLDEVQQDIAETETTTTVTPILSSSSVAPVLEEEIQREDINIRVVPDSPYTYTSSRQNPNSIEEDEPIAAVVVVSKKKHEIYSGKKSKFTIM